MRQATQGDLYKVIDDIQQIALKLLLAQVIKHPKRKDLDADIERAFRHPQARAILARLAGD